METATTHQDPAQTLLAEIRAGARAHKIEDHTRQRDAHAEVLADLLVHAEQADLNQEIAAHARALAAHSTALHTLHQADCNRAWEASMIAAEIDGSV